MANQQDDLPPQCPLRSDPPAGWLRRAWLRAAALMGAAWLPFRRAAATEVPVAQRLGSPSSGLPKWGMVVDLDKCTSCGACVVACAAENNVPLGNFTLSEQGRVIRWLSLIAFTRGEYPHVAQRILPVPCQMCDNPPCIRVCPVYATYKNPEGIVIQIYPRCIGCRYCVNNCPYICKFFNWWAPNFPKEIQQGFNPDVSTRPRGVTEKCTFCHHRLQRAREQARAEGRALKQGDYIPACVEACPAAAMYFGDLNDPNSEVSRLARSGRTLRLLEELGTEPKVIYLTEE